MKVSFMGSGNEYACAIMSQLFAHFLSLFCFFATSSYHPCQTKVFREEEDIFCMSCLLPGSAQFSQLFFISKLLLMQKCNSCTQAHQLTIDFVELFLQCHLHNNNLCQPLKSTGKKITLTSSLSFSLQNKLIW